MIAPYNKNIKNITYHINDLVIFYQKKADKL